MKLIDIEGYFKNKSNLCEIDNLRSRMDDLNKILFEQMDLAKEQVISKYNLDFSISIEKEIDLNNACAKKIDDRNYKINIGEKFTLYFFYFISKNSENLLEVLNNDEHLENKFKCVPINDIRDFVYSISMLLFFYHELAHILNNHLGFIKDKKLSTQELYWEFTDDESINDNIKIWQALEAEADSFGVQNSFLHFMGYEKPQFEIFQEFHQKCGSDDSRLRLYGYAIAMTFLFLEIRSKGFNSINSKHPKPLVRLSRSSTDINQKDMLTIIIILESCYMNIHNKFKLIEDYLSKDVFNEVCKLMSGMDNLTKLGLKRFIS